MSLQRVNFEVSFLESTPKRVVDNTRSFLLGFADVHSCVVNSKRVYGSGPSLWVRRRLDDLKFSSSGKFIISIRIFKAENGAYL